MSTGRDGTIIVVQTQGVTPEDDRKEKNLFKLKQSILRAISH
jgi:hypothetical protein